MAGKDLQIARVRGIGIAALGLALSTGCWLGAASAQTDDRDPLILEGREIAHLYNSGHYAEVITQVPSLLEKIEQKVGEDNQLF